MALQHPDFCRCGRAGLALLPKGWLCCRRRGEQSLLGAGSGSGEVRQAFRVSIVLSTLLCVAWLPPVPPDFLGGSCMVISPCSKLIDCE